jgi:DNA-binding NarL/FixJ family response regulator
VNPLEELTQRETDVVDCVMDGLSDKEIGAALGICVPTVKHHLVSIRHKWASLIKGTRLE